MLPHLVAPRPLRTAPETPADYAAYLLQRLEANDVDPMAAWNALRTCPSLQYQADGAPLRVVARLFAVACESRSASLVNALTGPWPHMPGITVATIQCVAEWLRADPDSEAAMVAAFQSASSNWDAVCDAGFAAVAESLAISTLLGSSNTRARPAVWAHLVLQRIPEASPTLCAALDSYLDAKHFPSGMLGCLGCIPSLKATEAAAPVLHKLAVTALAHKHIFPALFGHRKVLQLLQASFHMEQLFRTLLECIQAAAVDKHDADHRLLQNVVLLPRILAVMHDAGAADAAVARALHVLRSVVGSPDECRTHCSVGVLHCVKTAIALCLMFFKSAAVQAPENVAFLKAVQTRSFCDAYGKSHCDTWSPEVVSTHLAGLDQCANEAAFLAELVET